MLQVIHQVDRKFLACLINTRDTDSAQDPGTEGNALTVTSSPGGFLKQRLLWVERQMDPRWNDSVLNVFLPLWPCRKSLGTGGPACCT